MDSWSQVPGPRRRRRNFQPNNHRSGEDPLTCGGCSVRPRREVFERDSLGYRDMQCETRASLRHRIVGYPAVLRLHDAFDEMQAQSVSRNIGADSRAAVERFEQVAFIGGVDSRTTVGNAEPYFFRTRIHFCGDFDMRFVTRLTVFQSIAQEILYALHQGRSVCKNGRQFRIDMRREVAL